MAFEHRFAKAQATEVIDLSWGFAILQADFPLSHYHNRIVVTSAVSTGDVLAAADEVLGTASLRHRYVCVDDDALGIALAADFAAAGYEQATIVSMIHSGPEPEPPAHEVQEMSLDALRPAIVRDWRVDMPNARDEVLDQLAGRTALYSRGAEVTLLAVLDGKKVAARADLYIDRAEGIAQFESLFTHPDFRGRGYGNSLVREALRRGKQAGCELSFLTADLDDWPHQWYLRHGYVEACRSHHFHRSRSSTPE